MWFDTSLAVVEQRCEMLAEVMPALVGQFKNSSQGHWHTPAGATASASRHLLNFLTNNLLHLCLQEAARLQGLLEEREGTLAAVQAAKRSAEASVADLSSQLAEAQAGGQAAQKELRSRLEQMEAVKGELQQVRPAEHAGLGTGTT